MLIPGLFLFREAPLLKRVSMGTGMSVSWRGSSVAERALHKRVTAGSIPALATQRQGRLAKW